MKYLMKMHNYFYKLESIIQNYLNTTMNTNCTSLKPILIIKESKFKQENKLINISIITIYKILALNN